METEVVDTKEVVAAAATEAIALEVTAATEDLMVATAVATVTEEGTGVMDRKEGMEATEGRIGAMEGMIPVGAAMEVTLTEAPALVMTVPQLLVIATGLLLKEMLVATPLPVAAVVMAVIRHSYHVSR
jgi:hypothetical protein